MSKAALKVIKDSMNELNLNYEFMEYSCTPNYPYFTGEYQEIESVTEDGLQETSFILNGFSRQSWIQLENAKEDIENYFNKNSGKVTITDDGDAVVIMYGNSLVVPTGESELKRIQINLQIKEWRV